MLFTYRTMEDTADIQKTSYEINKHHIMKYYKNRYDTDEEFKKKELDRINNTNKQRYQNDPEYKQKCKENVYKYRARKKLENDLKESLSNNIGTNIILQQSIET